MPIILQDTGDVLMKPFFPGWLNYRPPVFYRKNTMDVQLSKSV